MDLYSRHRRRIDYLQSHSQGEEHPWDSIENGSLDQTTSWSEDYRVAANEVTVIDHHAWQEIIQSMLSTTSVGPDGNEVIESAAQPMRSELRNRSFCFCLLEMKFVILDRPMVVFRIFDTAKSPQRISLVWIVSKVHGWLKSILPSLKNPCDT